VQDNQAKPCTPGLWVGLGCQQGVSSTLIAVAIHQVCALHNLNTALILGIATLDTKATEVGILDLCTERQWALRWFSAEQLRVVQVLKPKANVMAKVATPSVAEAAAILAAQAPLLVGKQIIRQPGEPGVTIAIAQSQAESLPDA